MAQSSIESSHSKDEWLARRIWAAPSSKGNLGQSDPPVDIAVARLIWRLDQLD